MTDLKSASPSSCAHAATASESRFRIQRPIAPSRAARIVALDAGAAEVVARAAALQWAHAQFYVCESTGYQESPLLRDIDGRPHSLADELVSASVLVMVATTDVGADCAYVLGKACTERGIQTAGLVLGSGTDEGTAASAAVAALRPYARVLLSSANDFDVVDLLTALRV